MPVDLTAPPRCKDCLFWTGNRREQDGRGECHRHPAIPAGLINQPSLVGAQPQIVAMCVFPSVGGLNWCGEFHPLLDIAAPTQQ